MVKRVVWLGLLVGWGTALKAAGDLVLLCLGSSGGLTEGALSAYLVRAPGDERFVCLDAGTLMTGLVRARDLGHLSDVLPAASEWKPEGWMLKQGIAGYLISHPHLDHVAGLVLNSPEDVPKPIMALEETLHVMRAHLFNGEVWANFTDRGPGPVLNRYTMRSLLPGAPQAIPGTTWKVTAFPLSHGGALSTAFHLQAGEYGLLYVGDTGPDPVEHSDNLQRLWQKMAPWIRENRMQAILLEVSFPDERPDDLLFGHLTPRWFFEELGVLAREVGDEQAMKAVHFLVTHVKPSLKKGIGAREEIEAQLIARNILGLNLHLIGPGERLILRRETRPLELEDDNSP